MTQHSFETFCLEDNICPECAQKSELNELTKKDGETICTVCGVVWKNDQFSNRIPFGFSNKPINLLAEGKGLGGTLQERGMFCVLATQSPTGIEDLPIRAMHTRTITSKHEHPRLANLLKFGNRRCKEFGISDYATKPKDILIKNVFGEMLRTVGSYYVARGLRINTQVIGDSCFVLTLKTVLGESDFKKAKQDLALCDTVIHQVELLYGALKI